MFGNLGLHVIQFPSKRFGFVGSIPAALGDPATAEDRARSRAIYRVGADEIVFPTFDARDAAVAHAATRGYEVR